MRVRWRIWLAALTAIAMAGGIGFGLEVHRFRGELEEARHEVAQRKFRPARQRLQELARSRPGWGGGEVDYLLGLCAWAAGDRRSALEALGRVPRRSPFEARAALLQAEDLMIRGRLREAEDRLSAVLAAGGPGLNPARRLLSRIERMEARFDDVRALLRQMFAESDDSVGLLRELWVLDRGTVPTEGIRETLEGLRRRAPEDDRIWLGLGRVAILEGRFGEAEDWLRRCLRARSDTTIWLAWLDLARAADRPEMAHRALKALGTTGLDRADVLEWRAWLLRRRGDLAGARLALERGLEREPNQTRALEALATLELEAGHHERAAALRRRKAEADEALDRYRVLMADRGHVLDAQERLAMARLAERAGRGFDARAWCQLALQADPGQRPAVAPILARLDRPETPDDTSRDPWGDLPTSAADRAGPPTASEARARFVDDASAAGLRFIFRNGESPIHQMPEPLSGGVALLDYDGDGHLDVYALQGGPFPPTPDAEAPGDRLFRNRGDGTFEDLTAAAGLGGGRGYGHGVAVGDVDNDGHPDLFVTRWRSYALYRNRGDGSFADVTGSAGLGGDRDWPTSAALADLDGDGDLDLYVCHYLKWDPARPRTCLDDHNHYIYCSPRDFEALPDHLFRNDDGHFVDVTAEAGVDDRDGRGLGVVAADLDGDGKIDLFVANDTSANFLWRNLGGLRFEEVAHAVGVAGNAGGGYQAGMGVACGDLDGDGRPDLAVTNFYGESTTLYQNLGAGLFADRTAAVGLAAPSRHRLGFGISFLDVDNDGTLDLLTANGHLNPLAGTPYRMPLQLFRGTSTGHLREISRDAGPPFEVPRLARGLAVGDLDDDGRVDAVILDHNAPLAYLHNRTEGGGHALTLILEGSRSNRDAVGARVAVAAGGRMRYGWRVGGGSYQSASDGRLHFGLGPATRAESVEVAWPSGRVDHYSDLAADRGYRLKEGRAAAEPIGDLDRTRAARP